jgi:hypothetical protein
MEICLTIAQALRYCSSREENTGSPNDGDSVARQGGPPMGRLDGCGDGC